MSKVDWVTGRKKALSRALAMAMMADQGDWLLLHTSTKKKAERAAEAVVEDWIRLGVLATFRYDYREKEQPTPDPVTGQIEGE